MSEHDNGLDFAKRLSDALLKVRPLGGSEMFVKRNNKYYADPDYCGGLIEEKAASEIKWIKRAMAAEKALQEAKAALCAVVDSSPAVQIRRDAAVACIDAVLPPAERGTPATQDTKQPFTK